MPGGAKLLACLAIGSIFLTGCTGGAGTTTNAAFAGDTSPAASSSASSEQQYEDTATVIKVIDGDTIDVTVKGEEKRVRLLNVDTPETKHSDEPLQCMGPEATAYLEERLTPGEQIGLAYDEERLDPYGRTLAGVYESGTLINADIAELGLGVAVLFQPNQRFHQQVLDAQNLAQEREAGLFDPKIDCTLPGQLAGPLALLTSSLAHPRDIAAAVASIAALDNAIKQAERITAMIGRSVPTQNSKNGALYWVNKALSGEDSKNIQKALEHGREKRAALETKLKQLRTAKEAAKKAAEKAAEERRAERKATQDEAERREDQTETERKEAEQQRETVEQQPAEPEVEETQPAPRKSKGNPYPGYKGPRCYAPDGKSWWPCP